MTKRDLDSRRYLERCEARREDGEVYGTSSTAVVVAGGGGREMGRAHHERLAADIANTLKPVEADQ